MAWYWAYIADVRLEGVAARTISASGVQGRCANSRMHRLLPGPPAVATDADGDSIVAWECYYQPSNSRPHIVARTVAADGTVSPLRVLGNTDRGGHAVGFGTRIPRWPLMPMETRSSGGAARTGASKRDPGLPPAYPARSSVSPLLETTESRFTSTTAIP